MKVCKTCGVETPYSEYHIAKQGKGGPIYKAHCKECYRKKEIENNHKMPISAKRDRRRRNYNPDYHKSYRLRTRYGLTEEQFQGMIVEQNLSCKICGATLDDPQIDHNHATGKVRGLLCKNCNTSLGLLKENTDTLRSMITYINDNL